MVTLASQRYFLPRHVFLCAHGRHIVFLDLRADRYFAIETVAAQGVLGRVEGWSGGPGRELDEGVGGRIEVEEPVAQLARALVRRGLLTQDAAVGKPAEIVRIEPPEEDLIDVGLELDHTLGDVRLGGGQHLRALDVMRFVAAAIVAWVAFKCLPLERLVRRVRRRRARHGTSRLDAASARRCAAAYERLRPLFFAARDACLFESFAFLEFAARCGLYPAWVFGVQTTPFVAHCWVQHGRVVMNDSAERAAAFTPILQV